MSSNIFQVRTHCLPATKIRHNYRAKVTPDVELELCVKQYTPFSNQSLDESAVTIVAAPGSGFCKELYEPIWDDLSNNLAQGAAGVKIRSIYVADLAWQGESGVSNKGKLGNDPHWSDHSLDLLLMINQLGLTQPIIGIGHSMGGNQIVNLALLHPSLLAGVIAIEPQIVPRSTPKGLPMMVAYAPTFQQDEWATRAAAEQDFRSRKLYKKWDSRVLELHAKHSFEAVDLNHTDGPVALQTSRDQDVFSLARPTWYPGQWLVKDDQLIPEENRFWDHPESVSDLTRAVGSPFYRPETAVTGQKLPFVRPECLYIDGTRGVFPSQVISDRLTRTGTGVGGSGGALAGKVTSVKVEGTHFVPLENPKGIADAVCHWLKDKVPTWERERVRRHEEWQSVKHKDKIDDEWRYWMKELKRNNTNPKVVVPPSRRLDVKPKL